MHTKCTAPSLETAAAAASVLLRNSTKSARESSPDAIANSVCLTRPRPTMSRTRTFSSGAPDHEPRQFVQRREAELRSQGITCPNYVEINIYIDGEFWQGR